MTFNETPFALNKTNIKSPFQLAEFSHKYSSITFWEGWIDTEGRSFPLPYMPSMAEDFPEHHQE